MKISLISGASSGIGASITRELDSYGLDELWLIGRSQDKLMLTASSLTTKTRILALDLSDNQSFDFITKQLSSAHAQIEYLVLSAGVGSNGRFDSLSTEKIKGMLDVNVAGLTLMLKASLPFVSNGGKIINIASAAGFLPQPDFAVYSATKAYVISLSRAIRREVRKNKISVTAVCPGPVDTEFFSSLENVKEYKRKHLISPEKVARGALSASKRNKAIYTPTLSMKLVHLASKILPTSLIMKFYK